VDLGTFGVWTSARNVGADNLPAAAALAERLGFGTFWLGGSPQLPVVRPLLEATSDIVVATGIVNIWKVEPQTLATQFDELEHAFPGRVLLGVGVGHPEATQEYRAPLTMMREFLDRLDVPASRLCLAALAPRMLELAKERTLGAAPYFTHAAHTAAARRQLGEGKLLAPEVAFLLGDDLAAAREYAQGYLALGNYARNLLRHGFDEDDVAGTGSDHLIDAVIPHGSASAIADAVRAHLDAGADHVCVQALGEPGVPERSWTALAAELLP
jgi:probable F420-dependent oxidoreductase